ncbi:MAG: DUF835 domain-containing protein [Methanomassiliicoccales archaeon]|jgi:hypothetical protein
MDTEILINAVISLGLGAAALALIIFMHLQGSSKRSSRAFILVMTNFALAAIFSAIMLLDVGEDTSLLLAKMVGFCLIMSYASFLYLTMILIKGDVSKTTLTTNMFFSMFFFIALISGYFMEVEGSNGAYLLSGVGLTVLISTTSALAIITTVLLLMNYGSASDERKVQSLLFIIAVMSPLSFETMVAFLRYLGAEGPMIIHPIESVVFIVIMTYIALRYQLKAFRPKIVPVDTGRPAEASPMDIQGKSYIVESRNSNMAYSILIEELGKGAEGLVVSREHPDRIREQHRLDKTRLIWLTNSLGQDNVDPTNLSIVQRMLSEFQEITKRPIVLVDGIEVFLLNNKRERVLQMLFDLRDEFITSEGTLILSVDPRTVEESVLAMLEKDFGVLQDMERLTS